MAVSSQRFDFVRGLATDGEFPVGHEFVAMKFYPRLRQFRRGAYLSQKSALAGWWKQWSVPQFFAA